jgi:phosphatidate cytidylyltransferase
MAEEPGVDTPPTSKRKQGRPDFEQARADFDHARADIEAQVRATNAKIEQRTGRNLVVAIGLGLVLGGGLLVSLILFKWLFMIFGATLLVLTSYELTTALRSAGRDVPRIPIFLSAVGIVPFAFFFHAEGLWLATLGAIVFVAIWRSIEMAIPSRRASGGDYFRDVLAGTMVIVYVLFLGGFTLVLTGSDHPDGRWWTLGFLIVVVSTDTGAYASGLLFGKHPMAPRISPKKTWEGAAGSLLAATLAGVLVATFMLNEPWWVGIILGVTLALSATMGDLIESLIKRDLGIKDISSFLPGHGGFLDRLDSTLPSAAVAYALYLIFT